MRGLSPLRPSKIRARPVLSGDAMHAADRGILLILAIIGVPVALAVILAAAAWILS